MGSSFGRIFRITSFGESHGPAVGVVVDGCPSNFTIDEQDLQYQLTRRKPGQSNITTPRKEDDTVEILSGVFEGKTLGTPICLMVRNTNVKSKDYDGMKELFRPSHADFTYYMKYGFRTWQGGGRASARETIARVAAGALARQLLKQIVPGIELLSWVQEIGGISASVDDATVTLADIESNIVRCPDRSAAEKMEAKIREVRSAGDSIGGIMRGIVRGVPAGLGEPAFDKLDAALAGAMLSIPAVKGFELGSGFASKSMTGSQHNDIFDMDAAGNVQTKTNYSGGVQGGISNGQTIHFNLVLKPTATILKNQPTVDEHGQKVEFKGRGRHDPCVLPRAVPIVESMAALVILDHLLLQKSRQFDFNQARLPQAD